MQEWWAANNKWALQHQHHLQVQCTLFSLDSCAKILARILMLLTNGRTLFTSRSQMSNQGSGRHDQVVKVNRMQRWATKDKWALQHQHYLPEQCTLFFLHYCAKILVSYAHTLARNLYTNRSQMRDQFTSWSSCQSGWYAGGGLQNTNECYNISWLWS